MLLLVILVIFIAAAGCIIRAILGPTSSDRVVAVDSLSSLMIAALVILGVHYEAVIFLDVALIYALLAFIGTLAISKYLEGKDVGM